MGLNPCSHGRWAKSNETLAQGHVERAEGVGWEEVVLGGGWTKASQMFSNTKSYLPCKSAFVNATFVGEKKKKKLERKGGKI